MAPLDDKEQRELVELQDEIQPLAAFSRGARGPGKKDRHATIERAIRDLVTELRPVLRAMGEWRQAAALKEVFHDSYLNASPPQEHWFAGAVHTLEPIVTEKTEAVFELLKDEETRRRVEWLDLLTGVRAPAASIALGNDS